MQWREVDGALAGELCLDCLWQKDGFLSLAGLLRGQRILCLGEDPAIPLGKTVHVVLLGTHALEEPQMRHDKQSCAALSRESCDQLLLDLCLEGSLIKRINSARPGILDMRRSEMEIQGVLHHSYNRGTLGIMCSNCLGFYACTHEIHLWRELPQGCCAKPGTEWDN